MKYYYCDYVTSVNGSRDLMLEKKLLPFVKQLLYHKLVSQEDIEDMVGIIIKQQSMFRRKYPRLRALDVFSEDSKLPEYEHKFIRFGSCFARLEPVLGYAGMDVEIVNNFQRRAKI